MLKKLFSRDPKRAPTGYTAPEDTVIYAIGDVHGRLDLLGELERRILRDADGRGESRRVIVYLGDYVDRGYESRGVIDHLLSPGPDGFERVFLKGNHEEFLLRYLEDSSVARAWLSNGGVETLMSYGVEVSMSSADASRVHADFRNALPSEHRAFMEQLPVMHREGGYAFVHAGVRPGVPLDAQDPEDLLWIRKDFLDDPGDHGAVVVHGHTVEENPVDRANRIGIDTGAYAPSRL
ncbi:MAG: serine/threonine protein phosphatase, partial [Alphaproteobacteria bacterium]|nr:serine/threonine protein phosphatase [Alphaproteobacteria bacterium]